MSDGLKLLGSIIDTGSVHTLRDLSRDLFLDDEVDLYNFMRTHYRRYGSIPAIATVEEELGIEVPVAEEIPDYYIKRVHDRKLYGNLREHFDTLKECLRTYNMDRAKVVIDDMRRSTRIQHTESDIRNIQEAMADVWAVYGNAHESPGISGVPTGWSRFDIATGGYQPGDLVTWVARPSLGKTYTMLQQARVAWRFGYSVLVVTMEMTIEQIVRRIAAMEASIDPTYIRKGTLSTYAERRLRAVVENLRGADRFRVFSGGMKKRTSDVELLVQEYKPDIVYIDGVYLMKPESSKSMPKTERVSEVFDELKQMTLSQNIPVVVTTQFNRQAGKKGKDGSLENVAYTDAISTHSSLVIALNEGKAPFQKTRRIASFLKGREGEFGDYHLNYRFAPIDMSEVELDEQEQADQTTQVTDTQTNVEWMC